MKQRSVGIAILLSIVGLSIVSYALMQSELNKMLPPQ